MGWGGGPSNAAPCIRVNACIRQTFLSRKFRTLNRDMDEQLSDLKSQVSSHEGQPGGLCLCAAVPFRIEGAQLSVLVQGLGVEGSWVYLGVLELCGSLGRCITDSRLEEPTSLT